MHRSSASRLSASIVSVVAGFLFLASSAFAANNVEKKNSGKFGLKTYFPTKVMVSTPLRDHLIPLKPGQSGKLEAGKDRPPKLVKAPTNVPRPLDPAIKSHVFPPNMPDPIIDFEGSANECFCFPPDPNAAVGPDHIFDSVNIGFQIFDKTGTSLTGGQVANNSLWAGFGGDCEHDNDGDPIAKYDQLADRWIFSQFALEGPQALQCFAVSVTNDPLGDYYLSSYNFGAIFNDYPKIAIWPDAYYLTVNQFGAAGGAGMVVFDRAAMLAGDPATALYVDISAALPNTQGFLAGDLQGAMPPPVTTRPSGGAPPVYVPNAILSIGNPDYDGTANSVIHVIQMRPNFADPPSSVLIGPFDVAVDPFALDPNSSDVPQPPPMDPLEQLPFPMYPANYRNFGDHQSLVFSHDVRANGVLGRRWYEVRDPSNTFTIYQQGTFAPDDGNWRWMGSAAMDFLGNIAMGYSVSSSTTYPSVWYTGRLATDPLGDMAQGEKVIIDGTGSQQGQDSFGRGRWGDYSSLVTDPVDECTFWYTTEYIQTTGLATWQTRIGSFKFPSCTMGATGTLTGTVTDGSNPLAGVTVTAGANQTTTNGSGQYTLILPPGAYDMTASKYGFLPGSANGVSVSGGETTNQNFALAAAPSVNLNGVVKDGSGGGWPLYAKLVISGGGQTIKTYTDPVTGYYAQSLFAGIAYTFQVSAPGYLTGGGPVPLGPARLGPDSTVVNWALQVEPVACTAPGYSSGSDLVLAEAFDSGTLPPGWQITNDSEDGGFPWTIHTGADPCGVFDGNHTGGTGPYALANSDCDGFVTDDTSLISPSMDLSAVDIPVLHFKTEYLQCCGQIGDVDYSINGGADWTNALRLSQSIFGPATEGVLLGGAANQADVKIRFHYYNANGALWWQVDNIDVASLSCTVQPGGLVVGNVTSANTGAGLNKATINNMTSGGSTKTFATPDDPSQPDGLYILFSDSGPNDLKASLNLYAPDQHTVTVIPNATVRQDFLFQSGHVSASPTAFNARVNPGGNQSMQMTLTNTGGSSATFKIQELNVPAQAPAQPVFVSQQVLKQLRERITKAVVTSRDAKNASPLPHVNFPNVPSDAGNILTSFPTGLATGWGLAFNTDDGTLWITNPDDPPDGLNGDGFEYQYTADGTQTGSRVDIHNTGGFWAGDGAYNGRTGMLWHVNVGGDNCIFEINPASLTVTGKKICGSPWSNIPQRGLAYNIVDDTYYTGNWNEGVVYHFDSSGTVLDSVFVGVGISGLAYNPNTRHLFAIDIFTSTIFVLDAANGYAVLSTFQVNDGGTPVSLVSAGLTIDCDGHLWVMDQQGQIVYEVDAGEANTCATLDIPWLTVNPTDGSLTAGAGNGGSSAMPITLDFEGGTLLPGLRQAQVQIKTDTPAQVPAVPVTLTVRFLDVPDSNQFQAYIYGAAGAGIMPGGPPNCPQGVLFFCPNNVVTRADMAGYIWRAVHGTNTPPPVYQNIFNDVTFNQYNSFYIQGIFDDGITVGCGFGNFCPNSPNTRWQMAVFVYRGEHGLTPPPACTTQYFNDVPCGSNGADYINQIFLEGITVGCGGGNYCPNSNINNGQMATYLVKAFHIPYLP